MKRTLVIGATGDVGREVISPLIAANVDVRALTRNRDSAKLPSEIEIVSGDLTIPATLDGPLDRLSSMSRPWICIATSGWSRGAQPRKLTVALPFHKIQEQRKGVTDGYQR